MWYPQEPPCKPQTPRTLRSRSLLVEMRFVRGQENPSSEYSGFLPISMQRESNERDLVTLQGLRETNQILWLHANQASTRTVHVSYEKERDGDRNRQNQK